jgi:hypothetical protein
MTVVVFVVSGSAAEVVDSMSSTLETLSLKSCTSFRLENLRFSSNCSAAAAVVVEFTISKTTIFVVYFKEITLPYHYTLFTDRYTKYTKSFFPQIQDFYTIFLITSTVVDI